MAALLSLRTFAQHPPAPIWPADGKIPESLKSRYVFLTPDLGTVVIAFPPDENGNRKIERLVIHNRIRPTVTVDIKRKGAGYRYDYVLLNNKESQDGVTGFDIVVSPDPQMQTGAGTWLGGPMPHTVAKRTGLTGSPTGYWVTWSSPSLGGPSSPQTPLPPGSAVRFVIQSSKRPGFTTASADQFPPFEISSDWPEQVIRQANPLQDLDWVDRHVITLGPRYRSEDSAPQIAADYLAGIKDLIQVGRLDPHSAFVRRTIDDLNALVGGQTEIRLNAVPSSRLEREIQQGLELCLKNSR
ncbi:MAG: hypothetical protein JO138_27925 [Acidobacteriaceae bacterium]|nr:hypothetical protein [Acidobacteriaceae bacterium]